MLYNNNNHISKKKIELERKQSYHISTSDMRGGGHTLTMCFRPNKSLNKLAPSAFFPPISKLLEKQFQTLLDHS